MHKLLTIVAVLASSALFVGCGEAEEDTNPNGGFAFNNQLFRNTTLVTPAQSGA